MAIAYYGKASTPANAGSNSASPTVVTPPASMSAGQLVIVQCMNRLSGDTHDVSEAGGQSWTKLQTVTSTLVTTTWFWCIFDGTWDASPSFSHGGTNNTCMMFVFTPTSGYEFSVDVAEAPTTGAAPGSPYNVTITGITCASASVMIVGVASRDDNTWALQSGGSTMPAGCSVNNGAGSDSGMLMAYKLMPSGGATTNQVIRQTTFGGDIFSQNIMSFKETVAGTTEYISGTINGVASVSASIKMIGHLAGVASIGSTSALETNLKAYYKLDETSGTVLDAKGDNDGTNYSATPNQSGLLGTAYTFDATDYIGCGNTADLSSLTSEGSISVWVKPTTLLGVYYIVLSKMDMNAGTNGYVIYITDSQVVRVALANGAGAYITTGSTVSITTGSWVHLVVTWNVSQSRISIYKNNAAPYVDSGLDRTPVSNVSNFEIAQSTYGDNFIGSIDELGVWNRELTAAEVSELYNSGAGKAYPFGGGAMVTGNLQSKLGGIAGHTDGATTDAGVIHGHGKLYGTISSVTSITGFFAKTKIKGSTIGTATIAGNILGKYRVSGTITGIATDSGVIHGHGRLYGTIDGVATDAGIIHGHGRLYGTINGVTSITGFFAKTKISGTTIGTASVSCTTSKLKDTASSTGIATVSGTILAKGRLTGAITISITNSGVLLGLGRLSGSASGEAPVSAILKGKGALIATTIGIAEVSGLGYPKGSAALIGIITGVATVTGALMGSMIASTDGVATVTGTLRITVKIYGHTDGVTSISGVLKGEGVLQAQSTGIAIVSAMLDGRGALQATTTSTATVTGIIYGKAQLGGAVEASAICLASPHGHGKLYGAINGIATCSARPILITQAGHTDGSSIVAGAMHGHGRLYGAITTGAIVIGDILGHVGIHGSTIGITTVSARLTAYKAFAGQANGIVAILGILRGEGKLFALISNISLVGGTLGGRADLNGEILSSAQVSAGLLGKGVLEGIVEGSAYVTGWSSIPGMFRGEIWGVATVIANLRARVLIQGLVEGVASVTGEAWMYRIMELIEGDSLITSLITGNSLITPLVDEDSEITVLIGQDSLIS